MSVMLVSRTNECPRGCLPPRARPFRLTDFQRPAGPHIVDYSQKESIVQHGQVSTSREQFAHEFPYCDADFVGRVLLDEMDAVNGHLALVGPVAAEIAATSDEYGTRLSTNEQLWNSALRKPF